MVKRKREECDVPPEILVHLLSFCDPVKDRLAICLVCKRWNALAWLALDPSARENCAIRIASDLGCTEAVKRLLEDKRVDPSADYSYAI